MVIYLLSKAISCVATAELAFLHFILFTKKFKHSSKHKCMHNVRNATYNSLGGCSKARSAVTTYPYKEKEK